MLVFVFIFHFNSVSANDVNWEENYLSVENPGIGYNLIFLTIQGGVYMVLVLLIDYHVFQKIW